MKDRLILLGIVAVFVLAYSVGHWMSGRQSGNDLPMKAMTANICDPSHQTCYAEFDGQTLNLRFLDKPSALKPFRVRLESDSTAIDTVLLDFQMKGMDMGINRHHLKQYEEHWQNQVVLPMCTMHRNDWVMILELEQEGTIWTAEFSFISESAAAKH